MLFSKKPHESSTESPRLPAGRRAAEPAAHPARALIGSPTQSVIDVWLTITGNLESQGDVRVEGQIAGDIRCVNLVIGRDAMVSGDIVAEEAIVRGRVRGTIRANRVILQDTACVESAIYHKMLSIFEGATFEGRSCHRAQPHLEEVAADLVGTGRDAAEVETFDGSNGQVADASLHPWTREMPESDPGSDPVCDATRS